MPDINAMIEKHFSRVGLPPAWGRKIMQMESGGRTNEVTGSYKGLFQLDDKEFKAHGGTGSIFDPEQNTMAAANKLSGEVLRFKQKTGRDATLKDAYLIHNQGEAGYAQHLKNPDAPAWQNAKTAGKVSDYWAKERIRRNLPASTVAKYGGVENITSQNFLDERNAITEGTPSSAVARSRKRHEGIPQEAGQPSEVEARATQPTRKGVVDDTPAFKPVHLQFPDQIIPWGSS